MTGLNRRQSLAALLGASLAPSSALAAADPWAAVDAAAAAAIAAKATPGIQVCVRRKGRTVYSRAFGSADLEHGVALTPQSPCRIGSVTKQFTAATILLLAQDGKLGLDDSLAKYVPDFPRAGDITLRRMLSHTSGLGNYTNTATRAAFIQSSRTDYDTDALVALLKAGEGQRFEPGAAWAYSNTAYVLLGVIIGKVAGKPYGEVMRERLFAPLGLTHTAIDDASEVLPGRAVGYSNDPKAATGFRNASFISMTVPGAAGNLRSTMGDLCAWHEALLGGKVLKAESLTAMLAPALTNTDALPKNARGTEVRYGFGLGLDDVEGRKCVAHGGGIQGFGTNLQTFPDSGVTIAQVVNTDGGSPPILTQLAVLQAFRKALRETALA